MATRTPRAHFASGNNGNVRAGGNYFTLYYAWHAPIRRLFAQSFGRTRHCHAFLYEWRFASDKCHVRLILCALLNFFQYSFLFFLYMYFYIAQVIFRSWKSCHNFSKKIFCKAFERERKRRGVTSASSTFGILLLDFENKFISFRGDVPLRFDNEVGTIADSRSGGIPSRSCSSVSSEIWQPQANARQGSTSKDWCRFESHNPNTC